MDNLFIFILYALICFLVIALAIFLFKKDAIFTIAIGSVIGANVYNIGAYPVKIGNLIFGIDGVVYTIFLFCIMLMYVKYKKTAMQTVLYTALFSIFFTALLSFFGSLFSNVDFNALMWTTASFIFSIVATFIAVVIMIFLYDKLTKTKLNNYLTFGICLIIGNIINSIIYFGLTFIMTGALNAEFVYALLGSAITKFVSTLICVLIYFLYNKKF